MTISILLVDDHSILRQGLRALLEQENDMQVIGETGDGSEALHLVSLLKPDVIVLDLEIPGIKGLEVARQINERRLNTNIVILSMHAKEAYVLEALKNGASGYVLKGSDARDLIQAIRQATQGLRYLSPPLTERAIEAYMQKTQNHDLDPYETLTPRQRQILHLAAEGKSNLEIAECLVLSVRTVETHRSKMMHKLDLNNQTELVRYAIRKGILSVDE